MSNSLFPKNSPPDIHDWHLDKRIPLATIGAIIAQALALGWLASNMDSRLSHLEERYNESRLSLADTKAGERISVLESRQITIGQQLDRVETKLDKITDKLGSQP